MDANWATAAEGADIAGDGSIHTARYIEKTERRERVGAWKEVGDVSTA